MNGETIEPNLAVCSTGVSLALKRTGGTATLQTVLKLFFGFLSTLLLLFSASGIFFAEQTLHPGRKAVTEADQKAAQLLAKQAGYELEEAIVKSDDGILLKASRFRHAGNNTGVMLLHGQADNREGMLPYAPLFLHEHYDVLIPDSRAHGSSQGQIAGYGCYETRDLQRWSSFLVEKGAKQIFGLGESMGAAILLESLKNQPSFAAVVAESPYCSFRQIGYDRASNYLHFGPILSRALLPALFDIVSSYVELRYRIDLDSLSPESIVASTRTPVLLIHGANDKSILPQHSLRILQARSEHVEFWEVPDTGHTGAFGTHPQEFRSRVPGFFSRHETAM